MRVVKRHNRSIPKFVWLGVSAVAIVVLALFASYSSILAGGRQAHSGSPTDSFSVQKDPQPLTKIPAAHADENSSDELINAAMPAPAAANPIIPGAGDHAKADGCNLNMDDTVSSYNHDVQKQKDQLDNILSFKVGLNISSQYVTDYNNKVTSLFNKYSSDAKNNNCTWPIKEPALLPSTYTR